MFNCPPNLARPKRSSGSYTILEPVVPHPELPSIAPCITKTILHVESTTFGHVAILVYSHHYMSVFFPLAFGGYFRDVRFGGCGRFEGLIDVHRKHNRVSSLEKSLPAIEIVDGDRMSVT